MLSQLDAGRTGSGLSLRHYAYRTRWIRGFTATERAGSWVS